MKVLSILLILAVLGTAVTSCQKEHAEYRFIPKFHVGQLVQFEKSIEDDWGPIDSITGRHLHLYDIPQPFVIDSFYYNPTWRDNWYYIHSQATGKPQGNIDELSLQAWDGQLER